LLLSSLTYSKPPSTLIGILNDPAVLKEFNEHFNEIAPQCFVYEQHTERSKRFSEVLRRDYLPLDTIDVRSFNNLNHLFADALIGYGVS